MKKNIKAIYLIEFALLFLTILFYMLTKVVSSNIKSYLAITFLLMIFLPSIILFGFQTTKKYYSDYCDRLIITVLMIAGIIIYSMGLILGFTHGYNLTLKKIAYIVIPFIIIVFIEEIIRSIIVEHSHSKKLPMIFISIILALLQVALNTNYGVTMTNYDKFVLISVTVIPAFSESFLCTYLIYQSTIRTTVLYRLIVGLYMYVLPIVPNLGYYIYACVNIIVPFMIFNIINKDILREGSKKVLGKITRKIYTVPIIIFLIVLIILISGIFKYKLIAVASNSMNDIFYRGDSVILKYMDPEAIKKGDIIVFNHKGKVITHRVINIQKRNNKLFFTTKGDANTSIDSFITNEKDVLGRVDYIIKYIGYPTVWAKEFLERG